jgi:hypothetical protein
MSDGIDTTREEAKKQLERLDGMETWLEKRMTDYKYGEDGEDEPRPNLEASFEAIREAFRTFL